MKKNKTKLFKLGFFLLVVFLRRIDYTDAFFSASASSTGNTITAGTLGFGGPTTGTLHITKYFCPSGTSIDTSSASAQKPNSNGEAVIPEGCTTGSDVRIKGTTNTSGGDTAPPLAEEFTAFNGTSGVNGTLEISDLSEGDYGIAEFAASGSGDPLPDFFVLGFFCSTSTGGFDNNYEIADITAGNTTYCNIYNEDVGGFNTITPSHNIVLNEIMYDPMGDDAAEMPDGEWVELYNNSDMDIDVAGWEIRDSATTPHTVTITTANSDNNNNTGDSGETIVPGHGFLVVYISGAILNNNGDTVKLYDNTGDLIDSHTYEGGKDEGNTEARIPDGTGSWVDPIATPGGPNKIENEDSEKEEKNKNSEKENNIENLQEKNEPAETVENKMIKKENSQPEKNTTKIQEKSEAELTNENKPNIPNSTEEETASGETKTEKESIQDGSKKTANDKDSPQEASPEDTNKTQNQQKQEDNDGI